MKYVEFIKNAHKIKLAEKSLLYIIDQTIYNYQTKQSLKTEQINISVTNGYVKLGQEKRLEIYNDNFDLIFNIENDLITKYRNGIKLIHPDYVIYAIGVKEKDAISSLNYKYQNGFSTLIYSKTTNTRQEIQFLSDQRAIEILSFYGTAPYKLNHFRYLDIETKETLWEYRCEEGNHIIHRPIVRGDYVYFYEYIDQGIQLPDDSQTLVRLDLQTGEELARVDAMATATYMEDRGLLVALRPTPRDRVYNRPLLQYCIVELDSMEVKTGKAPHDDIKHNSVDFPHQRAWEGERVYFVSSPGTYQQEKKHHPSFGCFNVETLKVEFVQHLPKATGDGISQLEAANNQVYIRTTTAELFIYEHEQNVIRGQ